LSAQEIAGSEPPLDRGVQARPPTSRSGTRPPREPLLTLAGALQTEPLSVGIRGALERYFN